MAEEDKDDLKIQLDKLLDVLESNRLRLKEIKALQKENIELREEAAYMRGCRAGRKH